MCIAFGIRNVPDRNTALREMARVIGTDGRVAILELTEPEGRLLAALARLWVHWVVPLVGGLISSRHEYRYLKESIGAFPRRARFAAQMEEAGLTIERIRPMGLGACCLFVARAGAPGAGS